MEIQRNHLVINHRRIATSGQGWACTTLLYLGDGGSRDLHKFEEFWGGLTGDP